MVLPLIGVTIYYVLAVEPHRDGDLGKLGFIPFDDSYEPRIIKMGMDSLYITYTDNLTDLNCDSSILTIGDSFSQMGKWGYQNRLAELYPNHIVYFFTYTLGSVPGDAVTNNYQCFIDKLINDEPLPRIVILECVEREIARRLNDLKFYPRTKAETTAAEPTFDTNSIPQAGEVKQKNWLTQLSENKEELKKKICNTPEYVRKHLNIDNPVKHLKLRDGLFSCIGSENDLYFVRDDLNEVSEEIREGSKLKLDSLLSLTEQKGIQFVLLVASDKYDLYKDFTVNDTYRGSGQLAIFEQYNSNLRFLNCKELLYPHIEKGEKDIYKCDDTHWSPIASRYVAEEIKRRLDLLEKQ